MEGYRRADLGEDAKGAWDDVGRSVTQSPIHGLSLQLPPPKSIHFSLYFLVGLCFTVTAGCVQGFF